MTNNIKVIFDNSDLHIQENMIPSNIKVFFGVKDKTPTLPCTNNWSDVEGDLIDLDCTCSETWYEIPGDEIDLTIDCTDKDAVCDYTWKYIPPGESIDFNCYCPIEPTDSNDFDIDCAKEETADLGKFTVTNGEAVKFEIHGLEIYEALSGEKIDVDLDLKRTIIDLVEINQGGEGADFSLYREREFVPTVLDGQKFTADVKFSPIAFLEFDTDAGEGVDAVLRTEDALDFNALDGQKADIALTAYPSTKLDFNVLDGQKSTFDLTTNKVFETTILQGEESEFTLDLPYSPFMEFNSDVNGEVVDASLATDSALEPYQFNQAEFVDLFLSTEVSLPIEKAEMGEDVFAIFYESENHELEFNSDVNGEVIQDLNLSTETGFVVEVLEGQQLDSNIEYDPYTGFPFQVDAGEGVDAVIYRNRVFYPDDISIGEEVNAVLKDYGHLQLQPTALEGQKATFNLSADVKIGTFDVLDGQMIPKVELDELDNYIAMSGEQADFTLATDTTLEFDVLDGNQWKVDLKTGDPVMLGQMIIKQGENFEADVKTLRSYNFIVDFKVGERVYPEDWIHEPFLIDLDERKCCDVLLGDLRYVEMDYAPYNWTRYETTFGVCELMTFDLAVRQVFEFNASCGESTRWYNELNTFNFTAYEGQKAYVHNFRTQPTIDLDEGNPDPENPVIDIDRPDIQSNLDYIMMASAESVAGTMSMSYMLQPVPMMSGEMIQWDLLTSPPFGFRSYMGEEATAVLNTEMKFSNTFASGEQMTIRMYEPPYIAYSGEEMNFDLETKSDYYAEFVTEGCLNNDYHDIDPETGQPLPQEHNGTSVEGEMFSTYIEGRCF